MKALVAIPVAVGAVSFGWSFASDPAAPAASPADGAALFALHCSSCHGDDAGGVAGRGPAIRDEGAAAVDFVLRTGRMPMADPSMQARRGPVRFTDAEIADLIAYVAGMGDGPDIPDVEVAAGDIAAGGDLYRLNCAACHVASGAGAAIGGGREAPSVLSATPTEIGEAIVVGPGAMPRFDSFSPQDIDDVATYIVALQEDDTDGARSLGGAGPVAEGLAAWLLALLPLVAFTRWIGTPHEGRDRGAHVAEDLAEDVS